MMGFLMSAAVTVIIPTYNRSEFIGRSVKSAQDLNYKNVIIQVCDNASEDRTEEVVQAISENDRRVQYVKRERNLGALENMNEAIRKLETPYFVILSDDDCLMPELLDDAVRILDADDTLSFVSTNTIYVNKDHEIIYYPSAALEGRFEKVDAVSEIFRLGGYSLPGCVFRKDCGTMDRQAYDHMELDYFINSFKHGGFYHLNTVGAVFVQYHPGEPSYANLTWVEQAEIICNLQKKWAGDLSFLDAPAKGVFLKLVDSYVASSLAYYSKRAFLSKSSEDYSNVSHVIGQFYGSSLPLNNMFILEKWRHSGALGWLETHMVLVRDYVVKLLRAVKIKYKRAVLWASLNQYVKLMGSPIVRS